MNIIGGLMSEQKNSGETSNKVKCSSEDCDNFINYEKFFKVPLGDDFKQALEAFRKDPTWGNEQEVKRHACKWIITCEHESFKDNLWDTPRKTAEKEIYDLQFEKDMKDFLSPEDKDNSNGDGNNATPEDNN
jgi:hypothetical protein